MKTALLMSCAASALRLAPTMVLQPRRDLLAGGAAAAASTLLVPEALAKKPLCMPGTNPASALGGPGYTLGIRAIIQDDYSVKESGAAGPSAAADGDAPFEAD